MAVDVDNVVLMSERRKVFLMPLAHMAELVLHAMAGICYGLAHGLLRLHCVVAQGLASRFFSVLLVVVALLVGVPFVDDTQSLAMRQFASLVRSSC